MFKNFLVSILVLISCLALSACGSTETGLKLTVWVNQASESITKEMIKEFERQNPETEFNIKLEFVSEADAKTLILQDLDGAADVFSFASDHVFELKNAGALAQVGGVNKADVLERDVKSAIDAATVNNGLYAYPMTADNGYFMYYDKSVFTDPDSLLTLDSMIETAKGKNKNVFFDLGNGFYTASFLFANGATMDLESSNFDSEAIKTLDKYAQLASSSTSLGVTGIVDTGFSAEDLKGNGTLAAMVSGTWDSEAIQSNLGDNFGVAKLPTVEIDGEQKQLYSFAGYKYFGVKAGSKNPVEAHALANFLTNEENQIKRFDEQGYGPSNINAQSLDKVQANKALAALWSQLEAGSVPQMNIPSKFWDSCSGLLTTLKSADKGSYDSIANTFNQGLYV